MGVDAQDGQAYAAFLAVHRAAVPILCRALRYPDDRTWDALGKGSTTARCTRTRDLGSSSCARIV